MSADREAMINEFWNKLEDSPIVMLGSPRQEAHSEPMMACFDAEYPNVLFFYTRKDNRLVKGLPATSLAMAQFIAPKHDFFACLRGRLSLVGDSRLVEQFWRDEVASWYRQGKTDPMLQMIRFDIMDAEMWKSDLSLATKIKTLFDSSEPKDHLKDQHIIANM